MNATPLQLESAAAVATWGKACRMRGQRIAMVNIFHGFHAGHQALLRQARLLPGVKIFAVLHQPADAALQDAIATAGVDAWYCEAASPQLATQVQVQLPFHGTEADWEATTRYRDFQEPMGDPAAITQRITAILRMGIAVGATDIFAGEKNYETLVHLDRACRELQTGITVHGVPVVRLPNGVAVSSVNAELPPEEREHAIAMAAALTAGAHVAEHGVQVVLDTAAEVLHSAGVIPEYLCVRSRGWDMPAAQGDARLVIAAQLGPVLLQDSVGLALGIGFKNVAGQEDQV